MRLPESTFVSPSIGLEGGHVTKLHVCVDIRGLLHKTDRELTGWFLREDGTVATPAEAREMLMDQLAMGRKVLPFGEACEGFSYETGCPGHRTAHVEEEAKEVRS